MFKSVFGGVILYNSVKFGKFGVIRYFHGPSQTTNFILFQTEKVCRRQFQICSKWWKALQTGRKHCGKRRNCSSRAISTFPPVFSKGFFPRGVRRCHCVGMG